MKIILSNIRCSKKSETHNGVKPFVFDNSNIDKSNIQMFCPFHWALVVRDFQFSLPSCFRCSCSCCCCHWRRPCRWPRARYSLCAQASQASKKLDVQDDPWWSSEVLLWSSRCELCLWPQTRAFMLFGTTEYTDISHCPSFYKVFFMNQKLKNYPGNSKTQTFPAQNWPHLRLHTPASSAAHACRVRERIHKGQLD